MRYNMINCSAFYRSICLYRWGINMKMNRNLSIDICMKNETVEATAQDLIVLFMLSGTMQIQTGEHTLSLTKNNVFLISVDAPYRMRLAQGAVAARFTVNYAFLCEKANRDYIRFSNSSTADDEAFQSELRDLLKKILVEFAQHGNQNTLKSEVLTYSLALILTEKFAADPSSSLSASWTDDRRIAAIQNYVRSNYSQPLSLTEMAEKLYVSVSTLSRLFTRETGISFVQYVRNYRLEQVRKALVESEETVTTIAINAGFSSSSAMNRDFRARYQMSPKEYRERYRLGEQRKAETQWEQNRHVLASVGMLEDLVEPKGSSPGKLFVQADVRKQLPYKQWRNTIINVGPAIAVNNPKLTAQILTAHKELAGVYYRLWSLRSRRLLMSDANGRNLNFDHLDSIFDFFVEHNLPLFLDFGPRTMLTRVNEQEVIQNSADQEIAFESQVQWESFLSRLLSHVIHRYGERTVSGWIFEFSFFLSEKPYYSDMQYSSQKAWESSYLCVKRLLPEAVVAGPGLLVQSDVPLMELLIHRFLDQKYRPDIFTAFHFPARATEPGKGLLRETDRYQRDANEHFLSDSIRMIQSALKKENYAGKYYITDWNFSLSNRNYVQDSCYRAAFYLTNIIKNYDRVAALGIWYLSDLIDNRYDSTAPLVGSAGIFTKDGITKPSFFVYSFLQSMGSHLVYRDESCLITRRAPNDIQILCCNSIELGPNYYLADENSYCADELGELFVSSDAKDIHIILSHLDDGLTYIVRQQIVNNQYGNVLNEWLSLNADYALTPNDIRYLAQKAQPNLERSVLHVDKGTLTLDLHMLPNEVRWISIREARKV